MELKTMQHLDYTTEVFAYRHSLNLPDIAKASNEHVNAFRDLKRGKRTVRQYQWWIIESLAKATNQSESDTIKELSEIEKDLT